MTDLTTEWKDNPQNRTSTDEKTIYGTLSLAKNNVLYIRKEQISIPESERYATRSTSYWDFDEGIWKIDNNLQKTLDEDYFEVAENESDFLSCLKAKQEEYDKQKNKNNKPEGLGHD